MSEIRNLRQQNAQLAEIGGRLGVMIAGPTSPTTSEVFNLRRELSSLLVPHLEAEDWTFYPRLMASDDPEVAATARAFSDEMGGLAAAYDVYARRWDVMSIASNWHGFCLETRDVLSALMTRINRENRELFPLAEARGDALTPAADDRRNRAA